MRHRVDTLHGFFEPVARDNVFDLDELKLIGMGWIPAPDVVGFSCVADGALDSPAGLEEGVDHLVGGLDWCERSLAEPPR